MEGRSAAAGEGAEVCVVGVEQQGIPAGAVQGVSVAVQGASVAVQGAPGAEQGAPGAVQGAPWASYGPAEAVQGITGAVKGAEATGKVQEDRSRGGTGGSGKGVLAANEKGEAGGLAITIGRHGLEPRLHEAAGGDDAVQGPALV